MSGSHGDMDVPESTLLPDTQADATDTIARPLSARDELMARIVAKREAQITEEAGLGFNAQPEEVSREHHSATRPANPSLGEIEDDRTYSGPYADPDESAPPAATVSGPDRSASAISEKPNADVAVSSPARAAPIQPTQTFPIDIDGQVVHVTQDQMAHLARMGAIANQALYAYNQNPQHNPPAPTAAQPAPASTREQGHVDEARVRDVVRNLQYSDEATAAAALHGLISDVRNSVPQAPAFDPEAYERRVMSKIDAKQQLMADTSIIKAEYADVLNDPIRADAAARQVAAIRQQVVALGIQTSDLDIYREAGNRVRASFGTAPPQSGNQGQAPAPAGQTAPQAPTLVVRRSVADIDGRKRAAPQRTAAVIDRRSAAPEAPRAPTGSDIVEQMRKARHQSPMR